MHERYIWMNISYARKITWKLTTPKSRGEKKGENPLKGLTVLLWGCKNVANTIDGGFFPRLQ